MIIKNIILYFIQIRHTDDFPSTGLYKSTSTLNNNNKTTSCDKNFNIVAIQVTFDWPVALSFARYILEMLPNGRNNSCKSASMVSSGRFVTRIVAASSGTKNGTFERTVSPRTPASQ